MTPRRALPIRPLAVLAAALLVGSCGDATGPGEPAAPVPGLLRVRLTMPAAAEGAVLLALTGPALPAEITATQPGVLAHLRQTPEGATVALFGRVAAGDLFELRVPDVGAAAAYRATVREVAGEDNALREDLAPYRATVAAAPR